MATSGSKIVMLSIWVIMNKKGERNEGNVMVFALLVDSLLERVATRINLL